MGKSVIIILGILSQFITLETNGQTNFSGYVYNSTTNQPVSQAEIVIPGTNIKTITNTIGNFSFNPDVIDSLIGSNTKAVFSYNDRTIHWISSSPVSINLFDVKGRKAGGSISGTTLDGDFTFPALTSGMYFLRLSSPRNSKTIKIQAIENELFFNLGELGLEESVQIKITKKGYDSQLFYLKSGQANYYYLKHVSTVFADFIQTIPDTSTFNNYEGKPLNDTYNGVTSIKFFYDINARKIYYINSNRYLYHYEFASAVFKYSKGLYAFNREQYTHNPQRIFILGSVNHYLSSDTYTMEFFAADELDCMEIRTVHQKIAETTYFGSTLKFYPNIQSWEACTTVPLIKSEELFKGQDYQSLNPGLAYGYLKKTEWQEVSSKYLGRHDIALMNGIPNDIPVVAGIITTQFQTPLSHINILSRNRNTPNMALRSGWENEALNNLNGKLVRLDVNSSFYSLREASLQEAENYWKSHEPSVIIKLQIDTLTSGIIDLANTANTGVKTIGGKATNFAELKKIQGVNVPEGSFAIPFYYYYHHLKQNGLLGFIRETLEEANFKKDASYREMRLKQIRDTIKHFSLDPALLGLVNARLSESGFQAFRFRSSTNAEDVEGFNGAGLYDSYTGIPGDTDKSVEKAIKKVWASLWNYRAFEERDYFKIDHHSLAMGILVHRAFPAEDANGVVITTNLYNNNIPAYTINSQFLEYSVVRPEIDILPEQVLYYTMEEPYLNRIEYINKSNLPGKVTDLVLTKEEIISLANTCRSIETHYCNQLQKCFPLDIEFKIDSSVNGIRKLYIKQVRPFSE